MIVNDDCRAILPRLLDASIDAVVCDPPYELSTSKRTGFMNGTWDADSGAFDAETWAHVRRICKPGAWVAAFGGRRTWHRLACAMEDGGLIPRDTFMWAYTTGNVTTKPGQCTTVKPVFEPIAIMQVPAKGSLARANAEHGTGYLNIDDCRIPYLDDADLAKTKAKNPGRSDTFTSGVYGTNRPQQSVNEDGRHPSGMILDANDNQDLVDALLGDFQRYVIVPKASRRERDAGLGGLKNSHPSVKPVAIMEHLIKLLCPHGGTVLDPWIGSGTTGVACAFQGREIIGVERESDFSDYARLRVDHADREAVNA